MGKVGEVIIIELSSFEFDVYLMLVDLRFNKIVENNDGGENNNVKIIIILFIIGIYIVIVNIYEKG